MKAGQTVTMPHAPTRRLAPMIEATTRQINDLADLYAPEATERPDRLDRAFVWSEHLVTTGKMSHE